MDSSIVREHPLLATLTSQEVDCISEYLDEVNAAPGETVVSEGEPGQRMFLVLHGSAHAERGGLRVQDLGPGDHFGELALFGERPRAATIVASEALRLAALSREAWDELVRARPTLAARFLQLVVGRLGADLVRVTDNVRALVRERSLPRRTKLEVTIDGRRRTVPMGAAVGSLLDARDGDALVVAALVDKRPVALNTRLAADATIEALTTRSWEGREVVRRSAGLVLLEAAHRAVPDVELRLGPSLSSAQIVEVPANIALAPLARRVGDEMRALAARDAELVEESWTVEEAISYFASHGWDDAAKLLGAWRNPTVPLVTCGSVYALSFAPFLPSAGPLRDLGLRVYRGRLLLDFGEAVTNMLPPGPREVDDASGERRAPRSVAPGASLEPPRSSPMADEHTRWLAALGVTSVGSFNERCVSGQVSELIRAAEGFHEKSIGRVADDILARGPDLRIICIAGPSSSGKTTFIKRLTVQLQINGILPRAISLDDYYVDRERTPRDASGDYDFEALEALELSLLQRHVRALLAGETVRTAKYDFLTGKSFADKGPELHLGAREVLMLEGIHGLNPALLGDAAARDTIYRIFIHPVVGLSFDRLTSVSPADIRLVRRIVRDRRGRGYSAAENIARWPSVREGERKHIFPFLPEADTTFDSSIVYEPSVLKVYADRYLLEVPREHESYTTAYRLRRLLDRFVTIYPDHVPPTSILREFIGGSGFEY